MTQAESLIKELSLANELYRKGTPCMPDSEFDIKLRTLQPLLSIEEFEEFRQTLMEPAGDVKHEFTIGSLNKIRYGENELQKWLTTYKVTTLFWSYKLDGMSFVAKYDGGKLVSFTTRGDGFMGVNIMSRAEHIQNLPLIAKADQYFTGTVRGELVLENDSHTILGYKNRRNGVVGVIKKDEILPERLKHVVAYAYQILDTTLSVPSQFGYLEEFGFKTPSCGKIEVRSTIEEDLKDVFSIPQIFDFDGIVLCTLDYTNEDAYFPERQVAFKVNSEGIPCKVIGITWDVSKNYLLKPVINIEPTDIDGATVSNVTGYNAQWIFDNKIQIDAVINVIRSGNVIPKCIGVVFVPVTDTPRVGLNDSCPCCGGNIAEHGVDLKCQNVDCPSATVKQVESFIKNSGIENVSQSRLEEWGILTFTNLLEWTPDSSYKTQVEFYEELLKKVFNQLPEDIMRNFSFEGFGQTLFDNLLKHVGKFAAMFNVFENINESTLPAGIGVRTLEKARDDWKSNTKILRAIVSDPRYVRPEPKAEPKLASLALAGYTFLITGTLSCKRGDKEALIKSHGGDIASGVSKNLSFLVAAQSESGSSKYVKATKLGIPIITEAQLDAMMGL